MCSEQGLSLGLHLQQCQWHAGILSPATVCTLTAETPILQAFLNKINCSLTATHKIFLYLKPPPHTHTHTYTITAWPMEHQKRCLHWAGWKMLYQYVFKSQTVWSYCWKLNNAKKITAWNNSATLFYLLKSKFILLVTYTANFNSNSSSSSTCKSPIY